MFWGIVLLILGIVALGVGVVGMIEWGLSPGKFQSWESTRKFLLSLLLILVGIWLGTSGGGRLFPKESAVYKWAAWETPSGTRGVAYESMQ